ncbi:type I methionyl aminopeptidase [Sanguibacter inulinus]|uniref:Methionine aminopeptidase n=1 Tax=Sanguibacter inulinus TaxID=60922 RepID=A0A853ENG2_9MICO|nr:type I methionyl aminopeptidase [Sanguibacter inulinus]MBF0721020.1 type I methionyl aminopeptidase [Sanguibacter inulinus]NYS92165.1 type I methionyl aminopeptidase [Sanguibacter inulinus]
MFGREKIEYKTPEQVSCMRRAGLVVAAALRAVEDAAAAGLTTADLDAVAAAVIADAGATASFLGYEGFPATVCVSVNDAVIHGIPGGRVLVHGDLVSVDCGAIVDGWHADAAVSFVVGGEVAADPRDLALIRATDDAMWAGVAALASGERLSAVANAVDDSITDAAERDGARYGIVEDYVGHGIGTAMHQPPDVLNYRTRERGAKIRPGMCLAVEPMVTRGDQLTHVCEDDWTVVSSDGSRAAHWEHTVAILEDGLWVLTAEDGGAARLAALGVEIAPV